MDTRAREKDLARQMIQLIINHDQEDGEHALIEKCIPLINEGAYLGFIDENEMTILDWAKLFNYSTLHLLTCSVISETPNIERSRKRSLLMDAFNNTENDALRTEISNYWKQATLSDFEIEVLHKGPSEQDPPPSSIRPS